MTQEDRIRYNKAITTIEREIIERPYDENPPNTAQLLAMHIAVPAMNAYAYDNGKNLDRQVAIIEYHLAYPTAILFRDRHTMKAMCLAVTALKYAIGAHKDDVR